MLPEALCLCLTWGEDQVFAVTVGGMRFLSYCDSNSGGRRSEPRRGWVWCDAHLRYVHLVLGSQKVLF